VAAAAQAPVGWLVARSLFLSRCREDTLAISLSIRLYKHFLLLLLHADSCALRFYLVLAASLTQLVVVVGRSHLHKRERATD